MKLKNRLESRTPVRRLTALTHLNNLRGLDLSDRQLTELPPSLQVDDLQGLDLSGNWLRSLPVEVGQLTNLQGLDLSDNQLTTLPPEIGQLTNLQFLDLSGNWLESLPPEIGRLANLQGLNLRRNQLTTLPPDIGRLANLQLLDLTHNRLTAMPPELGHLTNLQLLDLTRNQLTTLPWELGGLADTIELHLHGNPLLEPMPDLVWRGVPELLAYLRSLETGQPQYEAKVLLVGEGNVGKTSLVASLQGEPFQEGRDTTHGIGIRTLTLPHPELDTTITLNIWDFGGQEVYRITHQFFFSRRALYLLVWRPREGQEENAIEAWCRRIRLRVGDDARILVVATHCDERSPELDYPTLVRRFGDLLVGQHAVDNLSGRGIEDLHRAIAAEASRLPQMGELISERWIAAREALLSRAEPQIAYQEFAETCAWYGMDDGQTRAFSGLLHDLGHIIYYGEDEGLRDVVVLQPEWLTKAIGYVLEDHSTRDAGGILRHARLKEIWQDCKDGESYPAECHPYFLRLMEKFDVSYRLADEENASLVGQLVPYERPFIPWDDIPPADGVRTLSLTCHMSEPAPGLIAWLTVRNHRFAVNRHWRRGVFLVHLPYASEAMFELTSERELTLEVRAPSPEYFFNLLRDSLEDLINRRWPGLSYDLLVPCTTVNANGSRCPGEFKVRSLRAFRERGETVILCHDCTESKEVARLLTGFSTPSRLDSLELNAVREQLEERAGEVHRIEGHAADAANHIRNVLKRVSEEVDDCPRLFTLIPTGAGGLRRLQIWRSRYQLTIWCEHPGAWHPCPEATYVLTRTRDMLKSIGPYATLSLHILNLLVPIAAAAEATPSSTEALLAARHEVELAKGLVEKLPRWVELQERGLDQERGLSAGQAAGLRALRAALLEKDPSREFGRLRRVRAPSGDLLWVCAEHYPEYDPGLPVLPD